MEACNFVRKGMAKVFHRKFFEILKGTILQKPCHENSVGESVLEKIVGRDSRPATKIKKASTKEIFYKYIRVLSRFSNRSNLSKTLVHHKLFFWNIVFKLANFRDIFRKKAVVKSACSRMQPVHCNFTRI